MGVIDAAPGETGAIGSPALRAEELSACYDYKTFCTCFNSHAYREHDEHLFYQGIYPVGDERK